MLGCVLLAYFDCFLGFRLMFVNSVGEVYSFVFVMCFDCLVLWWFGDCVLVFDEFGCLVAVFTMLGLLFCVFVL